VCETSRNRPVASLARFDARSSIACNSSSRREQSAKKRSAVSVSEICRVVRLKSRLPRRSSRPAMARDTTGGDKPSMSAARAKLFASTTVQNTFRLVR